MTDDERLGTDKHRRQFLIVLILGVVSANAAVLTTTQTDSALLRILAGSFAVAAGIAVVVVSIRLYRGQR